MATANQYQAQSWKYLNQAHTELSAGDLTQASEKGWGAAAQMVKAVAERRRWHHRSHELLFTAVETITDENGDYDIDRLFELASGLHINFYENWYGAGRVTRGLGDVKTFLDKLESLIDPK